MFRNILLLFFSDNSIKFLIILGGGFSYGPNGEQQVPGNGMAHLQNAVRRGKLKMLRISSSDYTLNDIMSISYDITHDI